MNDLQKRMKVTVEDRDVPCITQYVKNRRGQKVGLLLAFRYCGEDFFRVGFSKCNIKREPFNVTRAFDMALGRACVSYTKNMMYPFDINFPTSMRGDYCQFIERCQRYFKSGGPRS